MKKLLTLLFLVSVSVNAENLSEILEKATANNMIIKSKDFGIESKQKDIDVVQAKYYPKLEVGADYTSLNKKGSTDTGDTGEFYGKLSLDIYDGGKKFNQKESLRAIYESSKYDKEAFLKSLYLNIIEDFFEIKNAQVQLDTLIEKNRQLKAELERIKKFFEVGSATKDDIDKFQAEYSNNIYRIDDIKHQLLSLKRLFILKTGINIESFDDSIINQPKDVMKKESDFIKVLREEKKALNYQAKSLNANYLPKFTLENKYSYYEYDRVPTSSNEELDKQNKLTLSMSLNLYDNGVSKKQKESLFLQEKALEQRIKQEELSQNINLELVNSSIDTIKAQIISAKDSYVAAKSALETISKKFELGSVDNIAFLDALSVKASTKAQYEMALNNLQIAYAKYYYYANENIKDYIK